jgi:hypothetical protein
MKGFVDVDHVIVRPPVSPDKATKSSWTSK